MWSKHLPSSGGLWLCQNTAYVVHMVHAFKATHITSQSPAVEAYGFQCLYSHLQHDDLGSTLGRLFSATLAHANAAGVTVTYTASTTATPTKPAHKYFYRAALYRGPPLPTSDPTAAAYAI